MHLRNIFLLTLFVSLTLSQEQLGSDIDGEAANDVFNASSWTREVFCGQSLFKKVY